MVLVILYFYVFSAIGWILELFYRTMEERRLTRGGFSGLPICPIYGIGAFLILFASPWLRLMPIVLQAVVLGVLISAYEYFGGVFSEAVFKKKLWTYKAKSVWSFGEYADVEHAVGWSIIGIYFLYVLHPAMMLMLVAILMRWCPSCL